MSTQNEQTQGRPNQRNPGWEMLEWPALGFRHSRFLRFFGVPRVRIGVDIEYQRVGQQVEVRETSKRGEIPTPGRASGSPDGNADHYLRKGMR